MNIHLINNNAKIAFFAVNASDSQGYAIAKLLFNDKIYAQGKSGIMSNENDGNIRFFIRGGKIIKMKNEFGVSGL